MSRLSLEWKSVWFGKILPATFVLAYLVWPISCRAQSTPLPTVTPTVTITSTTQPEQTPNGTPDPGTIKTTANDAAAAVASRTPIPTRAPGLIQREVNQFTENAGLTDTSVLGLSADDWINIWVSALLFLLSYWLLTRLLLRILRRLVKRTVTKIDDQILNSIDRELVWLIGIFLLRYSILRLDFLSSGMRILINDTFFVLALIVSVRVAVTLLNFGLSWYEAFLPSTQENGQVDPTFLMLKHAGNLLIYLTAISIALSHFDLANNAISIVVFAVAVVIVLSIKDVITDTIYGFIILIGKPFREGDAIHVPYMTNDEWAWVSKIGSRVTHIRTRDNRILVIPNATMGTNQVTNYSLPDPSYRVQTELHFAYGTDFAQIQTLLEQTVRGVDDVMTDKPVEVIYLQFGPSTRIVRVRWWIATCEHEVQIVSRVNVAIEAALVAANIEIAHTTFDLNIKKE